METDTMADAKEILSLTDSFNNEKIDALLNLSMNSTQEERKRSQVLAVGFDDIGQIWEVIVKFNGEFQELLSKFPSVEGLELLYQYAILRIPEELVDAVASDVQISYMEKPKNLFFAEKEKPYRKQTAAQIGSCQIEDAVFLGRGVIIAVVDSGIDYAHPDFCNPDGTTRILLLWDQTLNRVFDSQQINAALRADTQAGRLAMVPSQDLSGHGTHVAGIAAGNGRASDGRYVGTAPEASLIVVKLGAQRQESFPKTTELMSGVDFCLRQAYAMRMPVAVNLSFGNNYGGHDGTSLLETYLDDVSDYWKSLIVTGTGNEGTGQIHARLMVMENETAEIQMSVMDYNTGFNVQIWKSYPDEAEILLIAPDGREAGILREELGTQRFQTESTEILVYYGLPSPYSVSQEIFLDFIPKGNYVDQGIWSLLFTGRNIVEGIVNLWLPGQAVIGGTVGFLTPNENTTLTIPSTSPKVLSVGAYDARYLTMAAFSGRGYTRNDQFVKPDLVAPGVDIISTAPGGGYSQRSGTSMAAPYVSGMAARMMEAGIVKGQDPFLYGSKLIAVFHKMAEPLPGYSIYPNPVTGWGRIE